MKARLRHKEYQAKLRPWLGSLGQLDHVQVDDVAAALENGGLNLGSGAASAETVLSLARSGLVELDCAEGSLTLSPVRQDFVVPTQDAADLERLWRTSRFVAITPEGDTLVARHPLSDCAVKLHDPLVLRLVHRLARPSSGQSAVRAAGLGNRAPEIFGALVHAMILLPCDEDGLSEEDTEPHRRQWGAHDLQFHARSRLGRAGGDVGATWRFRGDIPNSPAIRQNPWADRARPLYRPQVLSRDLSLWDAMETRRSIREYSALPLSSVELGEFLWRTVRVRSCKPGLDGDYPSRPYPNGGGLYEQELYVTVDACADIERGFYYYDAVQHTLCLVREPDADMAAMMDEAFNATARTGRPQILFTIASRFDRFNWKYSGMGYAAQLKNVGVIYQTMYLVATAMGLGGCALGLGNSDRFARMSGRDWLEEGSIGEFMIGRPR